MDVSAGLDGLVAVDAPLVVDVELGSQQLVVGTLELEFRGTTAVAVEVPAGGVKQYRLESPAAGRGALSYTVTLRDEAGDEVTSYAGRARRPETEVVGVLGVEGIDTALRSARTTPLQDTPEVVRLDPDQTRRPHRPDRLHRGRARIHHGASPTRRGRPWRDG